MVTSASLHVHVDLAKNVEETTLSPEASISQSFFPFLFMQSHTVNIDGM